MAITKVLFISDTDNHRVVRMNANDLTHIDEIGSGPGSGNDEFNNPTGIACDGFFVYILDRGNDRIVKRNASTLAYVSEFSPAEGGGSFYYSVSYAVDATGTYLYTPEPANNRIAKRLCSDLSIDSYITAGLSVPTLCGVDSTHLYSYSTGSNEICKNLLSDGSSVSTLYYSIFLYGGVPTLDSDSNFYVARGINTFNYVQKRLKSTLAFVSQYGSNDQSLLYNPRGIAHDGTYLYIVNSIGSGGVS